MIKFAAFFILLNSALALEPKQILVIANSDIEQSVQIARYYCKRRKVPEDNILALPLGAELEDKISREAYDKYLAEPIRDKLSEYDVAGQIKCLLTVYGVPIKVEGRAPLRECKNELSRLRRSVEQIESKIKRLEATGLANSIPEERTLREKLRRLRSEIDRIEGKETDASVDSELSMVLFGSYELYRWQPNQLRAGSPEMGLNTLMVSRLDGPGPEIAMALVDKAVKAEKTSLKGYAYIDSRGLAKDPRPYMPGYFDQSLRSLAVLLKFRTDLTVIEERTEKLFQPDQCPQTAVYCGWYSLRKYIDAFDFVDGAIGFHIASLEAVDLRDPRSSQWCPAMLRDGITVTIGAVAEPYLHAFPEPRAFFLELLNGKTVVEAYYHTKPFNSWRLILIGDPLYRPFGRTCHPTVDKASAHQ